MVHKQHGDGDVPPGTLDGLLQLPKPGAHICGFILLAKNWSRTRFFLDRMDSKASSKV